MGNIESIDGQNSKLMQSDACNPERIAERFAHICAAVKNHQLLTLNIEVTSICNLRCAFCGMHGRKETANKKSENEKIKKHMSLELFKDIVKKCHGMSRFKALFLHGLGEPLLNPHLVEMVRIARMAGIAESIILITNGVLLKSELFKALVDAGVDVFRISLDIIDPDMYCRIKGADLCENVIKNIDACLTMIKMESLEISMSIECKQSDAGEYYSRQTREISKYFLDKISGLPKVNIRVVKLFNWNERDAQLVAIEEMKGGFLRKLPCEQPFCIMMIHSDGDVSPCCCDAKKELIIGNISSADHLRKFLFSEKLAEIRKSLLMQDYRGILVCQYCDSNSGVDDVLLKNRELALEILCQASCGEIA
ncbi:MAG: radical SAM protein [Verrucomicrobiae bacterium]|nr:radical SAM protein [Verrucomicrobiae bacterium]